MQQEIFSAREITFLKKNLCQVLFSLQSLKSVVFFNLIFLFFELYYNVARNWHINYGQHFLLISLFIYRSD